MKQYATYECKTLEEVKKATNNLDKASLLPIKIQDGSVLKNVDNWKAVYNISKGKMCSAVVPYYTVVQHKEYLDGFSEALNRLGIKFKMNIQPIGNRVVADITFENKNIKFDKLNEEFTTGLRLTNSYDKSYGINVAPRYTRLACTNGMVLTRNEVTLSIKHIDKRIREIEKFIEKKIAEIVNQNEGLQVLVSSSMKDSLEWKFCCRIIEKLFSQPKHIENILKQIGISMIEVKDKKNKKKKNLDYVWDKKENKKSKLTRWEIYNAITSYISHGEHISPHVNNLFQKKAEKILMTPLLKMPRVDKKL